MDQRLVDLGIVLESLLTGGGRVDQIALAVRTRGRGSWAPITRNAAKYIILSKNFIMRGPKSCTMEESRNGRRASMVYTCTWGTSYRTRLGCVKE
jgi:hypothetical protein